MNRKEYMKDYHHKYYLKNLDKYKKLSRKNYYENKDRYNKKSKLRYKKNKKEILASYRIPENRFKRARSHAKFYKIKWSITLEEYKKFLERGCYYCSNSLNQETGSGLDRINLKKGYEIKNVLPCCGNCNYIKQDLLTVQEMKVAMEAILNYRKTRILRNGE